MPETTEQYHRIPVKERKPDDKIRTIVISTSKGIKALYSINRKIVLTYLFDKTRWTMAEAKEWVNNHKENNMGKFYTRATLDKDKMVAVASQEIEDREGEVLSIDGWDLKNYKKNPVLMWSHNTQEPPIGVADKIKVGEYNGKKALMFSPIFHDITEMARAIKRMFEEGILSTFSVGFLPKDQDGNKYIKQELLEISAVPIPALPQAQIITRAKKAGIKEEIVKDILKENKQPYQCECIECGHKMESEKHCQEIKCPKCGGEMRRAERPGSGKEIEKKTIDDINKRLKEIEISLVSYKNKINELVSKFEGLKSAPTGKGRKNKTDNITKLLKVIDKSVELALREKKK
jgi:HK97 family phage prohead protease